MQFGYVIHEPAWDQSRIADALRARGHQVEFSCHAIGDPLPDLDVVDGVIVGGGTVPTSAAPRHDFLTSEIDMARSVVERDGRYLGNCLGSQILATACGATTTGRPDRLTEHGFYPVEATSAGADLLAGLDHVYQMHYESSTVPDKGVHLASSEWFPNQAFRVGERCFGFQFHFDARADMIEAWWHSSVDYRDRPGVQTLDVQMAHALRHEAAIQTWTERFVDIWLAPLPARSATRS